MPSLDVVALSAAESRVLDVALRAVAESVDGVDNDVLVAIKDALLGVVPFDRLTLLIESEATKTFRVLWRVTVGEAREVLPVGEHAAHDRLFGGFGDNPKDEQPRIVEDAGTRQAQLAQSARSAGVKSYVVMPIVHRDAGLGWLVVGHHDFGAPSQRSLPLLGALAKVLAPAVARARISARYQLLTSLVNESPDGMLAVDARGVVREVNASAQRMLGRSREDVLGRPLQELLGVEVATMLNRAAFDAPGLAPIEIHIGEGGAVADVVVARVSGTMEATLQVHLRDARARKAAEQATVSRVEQLAFLRALGEVMAGDLRSDKALARAVDLCFVRFELGALCALRAEGDGSLRLVASHGAGPHLRAKLACLRDTELEQLVGPAARGATRNKKLVDTSDVRLADDPPETAPRWMTLAPLVHARRRLGALLIVGHAGDAHASGDREVWESIANTISVALHAADDFERVVALEAEKRQLVDNLPVIVARIDATSGATVFANGAVERILGHRVADVLGAPGIEGLLADPAEREASVAARGRAASGLDAPWQDRRYRHADGRVLTLREHVYPVFDAERAIRVVEVIAYDITLEMASRKQLMQADRLASLGALAAGIAHEINNPVAFISLAAGQIGRLTEQLRKGSEHAEPRLREIASEIGESAMRIAEIVGELKLFTRIPDGATSSPVDVNRVLQTAITLTSAELRSRAKIEVSLGDLPLAPGTFSSLGQVFVNLLINASQAIDAKSSADAALFAQGVGKNLVSIATCMRDQAIVVCVRDTGVGIEPKLLSRIFDPFFTTRASGQGAGLGLAIAYDIVRRIGGDIRVESAPGSGTTFEVILPLAGEIDGIEVNREAARRPLLSLRAEAERTPPLSSLGRVLIIDDEQALVKALARQLSERYDVDTASTASDALARLSVGNYDAIVCDLRMPDQSGPAIYDAVLARSPDQAACFIFTTGGSYGTSDDEIHERADATGRPVLEKPFDGASFEAVVASVASRGARAT